MPAAAADYTARVMRPSRFALLLVLAACSAPPVPMRAPHSPLTALERVLAIDFRAQSRARWASLPELAASAAAELARTRDFATGLGKLPDELQRLPAARTDAARLAAAELRRRPDLAPVVPEPRRLGQDLADALVEAPAHLGLTKPPLGEPDDRRHRTDPDDDRPERSLWQRLSRRLWLWR
jgi:hypothetical protein